MNKLPNTFAVFANIICLILLVGCGNNTDVNHGYGYFYDSIGVSGLRLRHPDGDPMPSISDVELLYIQTAQCMGLDPFAYSAPLVVITDNMPSNSDNAQPYGAIYLDSALILIRTGMHNNPQAWATYKHEFVHHFLHQSGFTREENSRHNSPFFENCAKWIPTIVS